MGRLKAYRLKGGGINLALNDFRSLTDRLEDGSSTQPRLLENAGDARAPSSTSTAPPIPTALRVSSGMPDPFNEESSAERQRHAGDPSQMAIGLRATCRGNDFAVRAID
jgi:transcription initiation factor TFIID subunit TAF12